MEAGEDLTKDEDLRPLPIKSFGFDYDFDEMVYPFFQYAEQTEGDQAVSGSWLTDPWDWTDSQLTWGAILQEEAYKYKLEQKEAKDAANILGF